MAIVRKRKWRTSSGEWRTAWTADITDAKGNRERRQFATKQEADDFRIEMEGKLRSSNYRTFAASITVKQAADLFLQYCEGRMKRRERMTRHNYKGYEGHVRNYICPDPARHSQSKRPVRLIPFDAGLGENKLAQLTAGAVGNFRDDLRNAGVSVLTTRKVLGTLKLILQYAISRDLIAINVATNVTVIGRRDQGPKKIVPPSKEAMRQLLAAADPDFRVKLLFAAMTGVRAGELHALRWKHVNFEKAEVDIITRVDAYGEEDVTKTSAGMRSVPIGGVLLVALEEWKLRTPYRNAEDLVFASRTGGYVGHPNMVKRKFLPLFERLAELHSQAPENHPVPPARFNWHALRHFAISCWIEAGLSPKTVQTFAGHSTLAVTMDRYGHLFRSDDHRLAMDAIARQFEGEPAPATPSGAPKLLGKPKEYIP